MPVLVTHLVKTVKQFYFLKSLKVFLSYRLECFTGQYSQIQKYISITIFAYLEHQNWYLKKNENVAVYLNLIAFCCYMYHIYKK